MSNQKTIKTISIDSLYSWWSARTILESGTQYDKKQDSYSNPVSQVNASSGNGEILGYAAFEWDFKSQIRTHLGLDSSFKVSKVEMEFYYQRARDPHPIYQIEFFSMPTMPSTLSASDLWTAIHGFNNAATNIILENNEKTLQKITLGEGLNSNSVCTYVENAINTDDSAAFAIRRVIRDEPENGYVEISGKNMLYGESTEWRSIRNYEPYFNPKLIITYETDPQDHIQFEMRYTTSDPTVSQLTPLNSIGGYSATNRVFTRSQIGDYVNSTQTSISISEADEFPREIGLAQVGPEILRYDEIDSSSRELKKITRGLVTETGFPSSLDPFAEYIHYLNVDSLFNTNPEEELVQYRCVSIINTSNFTADDIRITLIQDPSSNVQIDVGIEVPKFESKQGVINADIESGSSILTSVSDSVRNKPTGYFNGAHLILDPNNSYIHALIESYDDDGSEAEFILDRTLTDFSSGTSFRINPAPSQLIENELKVPNENNGRFFGFLSNGGSNYLNFEGIHENEGSLSQYDVFYVWVKRILTPNVKGTLPTGAILLIRFIDNSQI